VKANGIVVQPQQYDDEARQPRPLDKQVCGENRFVAILNYLEFYITPGCEIFVEPNDSIQGTVRMDWTLEEFFATGGSTEFIDRLATILNIPPYRVHVVQVYYGSVVVGFEIKPEVQDVQLSADGDEEKTQQIEVFTDKEEIKKTLAIKCVEAPEEITGGAPILGFEEDGEVVTGDPIPPNPEIETDFPEIPTVERMEELFGIHIDQDDPKWEGFAFQSNSGNNAHIRANQDRTV